MEKKPIAAGKSSFELLEDADVLFDALQLSADSVFLDMACGFGRYSLAASGRVPQGRVIAVDLWADGIKALADAARDQGAAHIETHVADARGAVPLSGGLADACLLATALHDFREEGTHHELLAEISRLVKPEGVFAVVEFKKIPGPPGPPESVRITPEQTMDLVTGHGFEYRRTIDLGPFVYGVLFSRK